MARELLAVVFLAHEARHMIGAGKISGTGRWFESLGMQPGILHTWSASITEIGAAHSWRSDFSLLSVRLAWLV